MIVHSLRPFDWSPREEDGTLGEACAQCGAEITDDQQTYTYRLSDVDGWTLYESICPACAGKEAPPMTNYIDQGIADAAVTDAHRDFFRAYPMVLDAIRQTVGPEHFALMQPRLKQGGTLYLAARLLGALIHARGVQPRLVPSLWFYGQKYLREEWETER